MKDFADVSDFWRKSPNTCTSCLSCRKSVWRALPAAAWKSTVTPSFLVLRSEVCICTENWTPLLIPEIKVFDCLLFAGSDVLWLPKFRLILHLAMVVLRKTFFNYCCLCFTPELSLYILLVIWAHFPHYKCSCCPCLVKRSIQTQDHAASYFVSCAV